MTDLPDYYTQTAISEAEAAGIKGGLDANKSAAPVSRNIYLATDTHILYVCFSDGVWEGFDAAMLTQGILTLYANMIGGGFRITGLGDPTAAQDAATRAYVLAQKALCLLLTGGTMSGDIAMGTNKLTGLGAPAAQNDSLRYGQAEIRNNEIAAAAAIAYTKLALAASIVMADLAAAIQNAANGIVVLDASADVPDAQIPNLAAGKITSDRFPVDRLPAMTDEKIWKGTGANVEEIDFPVAFPEAAVGDLLEQFADTESSASGITYVKVKEIKLPPRVGAYRIKFDIKNTVSGETAFGRIYKNGVAVGTEQSTTSDIYATKSEDIAGWAAGDLCQLYRKETGSGQCATRNFRIYVSAPIAGLVVTDT